MSDATSSPAAAAAAPPVNPSPAAPAHAEAPCASFFTRLEPALALHALSYLSHTELVRLAPACSYLRMLVLDDSLWHDIVARRFPERDAALQPASGCWRLEALVLKRHRSYMNSLTQGRVGRISSAMPDISRISIFDTEERATEARRRYATPKQPAAPGALEKARSDLSVGTHFDSHERRIARQGSCTWSVLGAAGVEA